MEIEEPIKNFWHFVIEPQLDLEWVVKVENLIKNKTIKPISRFGSKFMYYVDYKIQDDYFILGFQIDDDLPHSPLLSIILFKYIPGVVGSTTTLSRLYLN